MKKKSKPEARSWHDMPHSPLPFRDGGAGVFVDANGHVPFKILPFENRNESPESVYERFRGDYHYILCAVNCHEELLGAAKGLLEVLEKTKVRVAFDTESLKRLIARAEEHFE